MNEVKMEWSDLKVFLAIARAGTLGGAARLTGQTQPTMGRRLRALEEAVGHMLFQRTSDGFILTDEGAAVLRHAERVEEETLAFERELAGQRNELSGVLRVSSSDWFGVHMLTPVCHAFSLAHPHVTVELLTDARLFNLSRREADLVFRIQPFDQPDIIQRKLMHIDYGLYGPAGQNNPLKDEGTGCSLITLDSAFEDFPDVQWLHRLLPKANIVFRSNSRDAQAMMCAQGAGLAVLPRPLGDLIPNLKRIDLGESPPGRDVWLGYHRDLRGLRRLRAFLDVVLERYGGN
ncbi:MAG TPA: LysR family transcriptional regulator [Oxalicibacterium sp.]|uniref:LysR family transcriptional regulator n=1 Tax=Oxalicibacterium sp. TaxID=2766525 RepID=UPI002C79F06E|nr:LysR family transcriptional regulator [Oxalicibacterium sp.]HWU97004.1 LysR family transcriptional regulator [Oxalicibacterium sp.]